MYTFVETGWKAEQHATVSTGDRTTARRSEQIPSYICHINSPRPFRVRPSNVSCVFFVHMKPHVWFHFFFAFKMPFLPLIPR